MRLLRLDHADRSSSRLALAKCKLRENIETVDITVTQESLDAHVQCLKENGYRIAKPFTLFTGNMLWLTIGVFVGVMLTGQVGSAWTG